MAALMIFSRTPRPRRAQPARAWPTCSTSTCRCETRSMSIHASYFDGKTSRRYRVILTVEDGVASISGEASRRCPLFQLGVSEASRNGTRFVTFPDGAYLDIEDQEGFARMLAATGHTDGLVSRLQQSLRATLLAALAMASIMALLGRLALPLAADL